MNEYLRCTTCQEIKPNSEFEEVISGFGTKRRWRRKVCKVCRYRQIKSAPSQKVRKDAREMLREQV